MGTSTTKTLSVTALKDGTVIDHIPAGQALRIIRLLNIAGNYQRITLGLNLPSKRLHFKDMIKIENKVLSEKEANEITVLAPKATINIIKDFNVIKKISTSLPETIIAIFTCPNLACITQTESVNSHFLLEEYGQKIKLICKFCEKAFDRDQVRETVQ